MKRLCKKFLKIFEIKERIELKKNDRKRKGIP